MVASKSNFALAALPSSATVATLMPSKETVTLAAVPLATLGTLPASEAMVTSLEAIAKSSDCWGRGGCGE